MNQNLSPAPRDAGELGDAPVTGPGLAGVVEQRWHHASPATWNRHVATVRSFARYCERTRILAIDGDVELQRRAEQHDHTRSIALASLERLWERRDIDLRERTLWRLLYETAARADEVLRLNVEDLDIPAKRARTRSKGGDADWLFFGSGSARLLPRLIAGRRAGVWSLADRNETMTSARGQSQPVEIASLAMSTRTCSDSASIRSTSVTDRETSGSHRRCRGRRGCGRSRAGFGGDCLTGRNRRRPLVEPHAAALAARSGRSSPAGRSMLKS
jgi:hypothetical protein